MKLSATSLLLFFASLLQAQQASTALYNGKGQLIADTVFSISSSQLNKWRSAEDSLTARVLRKLVYPPIWREAGIEPSAIVSFSVADDGRLSDLRVEKLQDIDLIHDSSIIRSDLKIMKQLIEITLQSFADVLKAAKGKEETYYLPVSFVLTKTATSRSVKNGWLVYALKTEPQYETD